MNGTEVPENETPLIWSERYRLAGLTRPEWQGVGIAALILAFLFVLFHYLGNTVGEIESRSAFLWMTARWADPVGDDADYSHGWLIPLVSLAVLYFRRKELLAAPRELCNWGLAVIVSALLMHWVGAKVQQTRISLMALILLLWGFPLYFFGWRLAKQLIFPAAYLIFAIPMNFLEIISTKLKYLTSAVTAGLLNAMGIVVRRDGVQLLSESGFRFEVAGACSGLRSLLAMTALTAAYAFFTQRTLFRKWLLFLCSIPIAVAFNMIRVTTIGLVAEAFGERFAVSLYHDYAGYVFFAIGILLMVATGSFIAMDHRRVWRRWKTRLMTPHALQEI